MFWRFTGTARTAPITIGRPDTRKQATMTTARTTLRVAFDEYANTLPLHRGEVRADDIALDFSPIRPANKFFKSMVRELKFDISEMAIGTYIQAKGFGRPLVLLPATIMGRFQQNTLLCSAERPVTTAELNGKRIGVRSYSQTTGVWLRGIMAEEYGVDTDSMHWFTQEDGHVAEYVEPSFVTRVPPDKTLPQLLRDGTIDVAIYATDLAKEPGLRHVIPNPDAAALDWYAKRKVVPINHMVVTTEAFVQARPDLVREFFGALRKSKEAAGLPKPGAIDFLPFGVEACRPALETLTRYSARQKMSPRSFEVDELFDATTRALG